jgi:hypothetical protein
VLFKFSSSDRRSREVIGYGLTGKVSTRLVLLRSFPFSESGKLPIGDLLGKRRKYV